jgi:glutamine amidotransferase
MGWNQVSIKERGIKGSLFKGVKDKAYFYFAQSYYCAPKDKKVIAATADYGLEYAVSVHKDNVYATQFHPEKSQRCGLKVFDNFLKL